MRERQAGTRPERDLLIINTEDVRRKITEAEIADQIPPETPTITQPRAGGGKPPTLAEIIDRYHKWCSHYVLVSNDHNPSDGDPVPNPGYRSVTATFSSVQDAITFAELTLVPKLANPNIERVAVCVMGGYYPENILIQTGSVDLVGVGTRPIIYGNHRIVSGAGNRVLLCDLELWGTDDTLILPALYIDTVGDFPATAVPSMVEIDRCYIHGPGMAIESPSTRIGVYRSILETDFLNNTYTNIDTPTVKMGQFLVGYTEFRECYLMGVKDRRAPIGATGYPNHGRVVELVGGNAPWMQTGVVFRNCELTGYYENSLWNLLFNHCDLYGGKKHATAGTVLGFVQGDSGTNVHGAVTFNHCGLSCRYIAEEADLTDQFPGPWPAVTDIYIQHTKQLSYDTLDSSNNPVGSTVVSQVVFGTYGFFTIGSTHVVHSDSWRTFWNAIAGPAEAAATLVLSAPDAPNGIPAVPIAAVVSNYTHW